MRIMKIIMKLVKKCIIAKINENIKKKKQKLITLIFIYHNWQFNQSALQWLVFNITNIYIMFDGSSFAIQKKAHCTRKYLLTMWK